jgi:hypothetical protein
LSPLNEDEYADLRKPPSFEVYNLIDDLLTKNGLKSQKTGKVKEDPASYKIVIENDPDFKRALRHNTATGESISFYKNVDNLQVAIMLRMNSYGLDCGIQKRRDIVSILEIDERYQFNSVRRFVDDLSKKKNNGKKSLDDFLSFFEFENKENALMYHEFFNFFFLRTTVHILGCFP